jgi:hypothetical protein
MKEDELLIAAKRVDTAAQSLAGAYRALEDTVQLFRKAAWRSGGERGAEDVNNGASQGHVAREVLGVLLGAGLADLFERAGVHLGSFETVTEPLVKCYSTRLQHGSLETGRVVQ